MRVQQQQGAVDCGLFAIVYAVHLANNIDPSKVKFAQDKLRGHLVDCLHKSKLDTFPVEKTLSRVARNVKVVSTIGTQRVPTLEIANTFECSQPPPLLGVAHTCKRGRSLANL